MSRSIPASIRQQAAHWLPVCPVHLIADRDTLILAPTQHLSLSLSEAEALAAAFNAHFEQDGHQLYVLSETQWFLGTGQAFVVSFPRLSDAVGMNLRDVWQQGRDAQRWRRLLNETQMLWFSHAVNLAREQQGLLPINGLWLEGHRAWWRRLMSWYRRS